MKSRNWTRKIGMTGPLTEATPKDRNTQLAEDRTRMAYGRTRLATDRTLMAYIRTSVSMIGFGFTIFKFFQFMREAEEISQRLTVQGPRFVALSLIALGSLLLLVGIVEHRVLLKRLTTESGIEFPTSPAMVGALILLLLGIITVISILFRIGPIG
jgi:putative membrane protein